MARRLAVVFVAALVTIAAGETSVRAQRPQIPAFRTHVTLVPLDARVLDGDGRPVTDLTAADFTILEDGVPQPIAHFSAHSLTPAMSVADVPPARRETPGLEAEPSNRRIFVIVLGRGRLQGPSKGLDAMLELVRERLLPQDLVAVAAYNRATDLTTDHEQVARVIERFAATNDKVERAIADWAEGHGAMVNGSQLPETLQAEIDGLFGEPGRTRGGSLADVFRSGRRPAAGSGPISVRLSLDYLRFLDGEKHIAYVTRNGDLGTRASRTLAAMAADARVALSIVQTGGLGVDGFPMPRARLGPRLNMSRLPPVSIFRGRSALDTDRYLASRELAKLTGGQASFYRYADEAVARIDDATRFQYLLGYYPENNAWDGGFRKIEVRVSRRSVTVQFRHGYYAHRLLVATDSPEFERSSRLLDAGAWGATAREIHVRVKAQVVTRSKEATTLEVQVSIEPAGVTFEEKGGEWLASLELAVVAADDAETIVGEVWEPVDLQLDAEGYTLLKKQNIVCTVRVETNALPRLVKAIVYDVGTDKVGSAEARIR